jgi:hypothetical protein
MHDEIDRQYSDGHKATRNASNIKNCGKILLPSNEILDDWKKGSIMPTYKKLCIIHRTNTSQSLLISINEC